jgi:hypothetical protein
MNLAQRLREDYDGRFLQKTLLDQMPANRGGIDRRGFEWYYWQRKMTSGHITLNVSAPFEVTSVAYSRNGKWLASGSFDKIVRLWDASTWKEIRTFKGPGSPYLRVIFSQDDARILSVAQSGTLVAWDVSSGQQARSIKLLQGPLNHAFLSPDGTRVAAVGSDNLLRIWDTSTGRGLLTINEPTDPWGTFVSFSPDAHRLAMVHLDSRRFATFKMWNLTTKPTANAFSLSVGLPYISVFALDGKRIITGDLSGNVNSWDVESGGMLATFRGHATPVYALAVSRDGTQVASAGYDQTVRVWDSSTGTEIHHLRGHTGSVKSLAFSSDGKKLASSGSDGTIHIWDLDDGQKTRAVEQRTKSPDPQGRPGVRFTISANASDVAITADGTRVASAGADGIVKVWNLATGAEVPNLIRQGTSASCLAFSPDGDLIVAGYTDGTVTFWDSAHGKALQTLKEHSARVTDIASAPTVNSSHPPVTTSWRKSGMWRRASPSKRWVSTTTLSRVLRTARMAAGFFPAA